MAAVTTTGDGNWSSGSSVFSGGSGPGGVPNDTDAVTITRAITLDTTAAVCDSLAINAGGSLTARTTGDSKIVVDKGVTTANSASASLVLDMSSAPQYKCEFQFNKDGDNTANSTTNIMSLAGPCTFKGADKKYYTLTDGALTRNSSMQSYVDDATGWLAGDILVFAMTQAATGQMTVTNVTYNSGGGYLEVTTSSAHGLYVGDEVMLTALQTALNEINYTVAAVPTTTTFRITMGAVTVTDTAGFASRQARTDKVTIATITFDNAPTNTGRALVTWTDGTGTGGAVVHDHDDNCVVGNFTRNVIFSPGTAYAKMTIQPQNATYSRNYENVMFRDFNGISGFPSSALNQTAGLVGGLTNCTFYMWAGTVQGSSNAAAGIGVRTRNLYYTTKSGGFLYNHANQAAVIGSEDYLVLLRASLLNANALAISWPNGYIVEPLISGVCGTANSSVPGTAAVQPVTSLDKSVVGGAIWGCTNAAGTAQGAFGVSAPVNFSGTRLGVGPVGANYSANNFQIGNLNGTAQVVFDSCPLGTSPTLFVALGAGSEAFFKNKNNDAGVHEVYKNSSLTVPVMSRVTAGADISNATSSLMMEWTGTAALEHTRNIYVLVAAGATATILTRVKKNAAYGSSTRPTVTAYDGATVASTATMADTTDTFETLTLSITNSGSSDKQYRVEFYGKSAVSGAKCWFSGVPIPPFVTRCRHYGYVFDETSPTRTVDATISAAFATSNAYTGITITWGATSTIALGASQTFQKLIDYTAAKAIANVGSALPITWAGVAGNAALFAQGNITTTGYTLNGGGSLAMGGKTLTASVPWSYTYTGGTFSQAASVPAFSGGTLNIGAAGTYTFDTSGTIIVSMTPTAPGTYVMGDVTASEQLDLRNTSAHAITVELSTAVAALAITSNNVGGTITISAPVVTADISITGMANTVGANNRLQIINQTAAAASAWQAATVYAAGDVVLRTAGIGSENTAGLYMRCTSGGTSGGSEPTWATTVGVTTTDNTVTWTTYAVLFYDADPAGTSLTDTYIDGEEFLAGETIEIRFAEEDPGVTFKTYGTSVVATADGFSALANESDDSVYATYGLSGAAYETTYSPNFVASYIVLDTNTDFGGKSAYAYYCYLLTTSQGMYRFWGGFTGIDPGNIRNNVDVISLYFDESTGFVKQTDDVRIFRSDGLRPALDPTTGGSGIEMNWRVPVNVVTISGASVLTPTQDAKLMAIPTAATTASATRTELAPELAAALRAEKFARNKKVLSPTTGVQTVYDDDGTTVLGQGDAFMDVAGAQPYDGTAPVHRTERLA